MRFLFFSFLSLYPVACSSSPTPPQFGAAEPNQEQAEQLREATALEEHAQSLFDQGLYAEALSPAKEAVAILERTLRPIHRDVATALTTLGLVHHQRTELAQAKRLLEQALAIRQATLGPTDPKVGETLTHLARVLYAEGQFSPAGPLLERSLKIQEQALGTTHPNVAVTLSHLAIVQRAMGNLVGAGASTDRAVAILRATTPLPHNDLAMALSVQGNILGRSGRFAEARRSIEESLQLREQTLGPDHPHTARSLTQLGMLEQKLGNYSNAVLLLKRALAITEKRLGSHNAEVAGSLNELGQVERLTGNLSESQSHYEQALRIQENSVGSKHPFVAVTLKELAEVKRQQGDFDGARSLLQRASRVQEESVGANHPFLADTLTSLGYLYGQTKNFSAAERYFDQAVRIRETALGPTHPDVASSLLDLARAKHAQGQFSTARPLYERARGIIQSQLGLNPGLPDEALGLIWKKDLKGLQDYALLLATMAGNLDSGPEQRSAIADGFVISQQARGWLMQAAIARVLAQQAVGDPSVAALAKRVDALNRKRQGLWTRLNELYGLTDAQRPAEELTLAKQQLSEVQEELNLSRAELQATAPRYAEVAQPDALNIQEVQRLLRHGEALVSFYALADRIQIWLVLPDQKVRYYESIIPRDELISLVDQVRASLRLEERLTSTGQVPVAFDVESATKLYELLLGPFSSQLHGIDNLLLAPDEALLPLPFAALITERSGKTFANLSELYQQQRIPSPQELASYASLPWLAKRYQLTILPATSALKLIRQARAPRQKAGEAFLGFGDPVLHGRAKLRGGAMVASRGTDVDVASLHELGRLPGTKEELLVVASVLGVKAETNLFLGERATEPEVRRLNENGRLGQARVIAFATHGLLANRVYGVTQPSLVLTPPDVPTDENDGLLSMEDVVALKLPNTEWVILSACNTAGDNGSGESLSGLARAFFFAGAKALLVSQWSVDDQATKVLMGEIFRRYGAITAMEPAKALQEGMLALLHRATTSADQQYLAHPYAWAPFMLVGDGQLSSR